MNKKLLLGVVVLVVAAVAASYIYSNKPASSTQPLANLTEPAPENKTIPGSVPTAPKGLTADEKAAVASFGPDTDNDTQIALATKVAKETGSINVSNCAFVPAVLKIKAGENFVLENKGATEAVVTFYVDNKPHSVAAGATTTIKADFGNGDGGLFGFYCRVGSTTHQSAVLVYSI